MSYSTDRSYMESIPLEQLPADELVRVATSYIELRSKRDMLQAELIEMERLMKEADNRINALLREGHRTDERIGVIKNAALHVFNNSLEDIAYPVATVRNVEESIEELKARLF